MYEILKITVVISFVPLLYLGPRFKVPVLNYFQPGGRTPNQPMELLCHLERC